MSEDKNPPAASQAAQSQPDPGIAAPQTASPAEAQANPAPQQPPPEPEPKFDPGPPPSDATLRKFVEQLERSRLTAWYQFGERLRTLINERWSRPGGE
jgi:hypothetical protein